MLVSCWSAKGGSGTTVVSVALALLLARSAPSGALLVDLAGDVPAVLGLPEPDGAGALDWLAAGADTPADALGRLELRATDRLSVVPRGGGAPAGPHGAGGPPTHGATAVDRAELFAAVLTTDARPVVADCGTVTGPGPGLTLAASASVSLLVTRPCFLALRRVSAAPLRPSGVVLLAEPGRALGRREVEDVVGAPVRAEVAWDPAVARAVDAGLLASRLPRALARALRSAA